MNLTDYHMGRSVYLSEEEERKLGLELESKIYSTTRAIILYVKKEFGVIYTIKWNDKPSS